MKKSKIGWTTHSWNPVVGCRKISPGCHNCYAAALAERYNGGAAWPNGFDVTLKPHRMDDPVKWKEPAFIFVNSLSDLFHREIPKGYLAEIWHTMTAKAPRHVYQVLTKRPHIARERIRDLGLPLTPNIWLGVSVENMEMARNRIPVLLDIGSPVPWISAEPLLDRLDLAPWMPKLKWVVDGGESGPNRRFAAINWFRFLRDQCSAWGVPYFHKQGNSEWPGHDRVLDGRIYSQMPKVEGLTMPERETTRERTV